MPDLIERRKEMLEQHREETLRLLKEYEDMLRVEDDPGRRLRYERKIQQLKADLARYQYELVDPFEAYLTAERNLKEGLEIERQHIAQLNMRRQQIQERPVVNLRPLDVRDSFKDRSREIAQLAAYLSDDAVRLIAVIGRAGIGKTALVSRVFETIEHNLSIPLAPQDQEQKGVKGIIYMGARTTGISLDRLYIDVGYLLGEPIYGELAQLWKRVGTVSDKAQQLVSYLCDGVYIILWDNFEDLLTSDGTITDEGVYAFLESLLRQQHGIKLVITCREEILLPVGTYHRARFIRLDKGLPEDDAITLMRELDHDGEGGLLNAPEHQLRDATRRVFGIPRAIEIIAGILRQDPTVSLEDLLLDHDLFGERVVENLIAEGYIRMDEKSRRVIEALAVLHFPVPSVAVEYLLFPFFPDIDVAEVLTRLLRSHFITYSKLNGTFSLHPLDQQYFYDRIPNHSNPRKVSQLDDGQPYSRRELELRAADYYVQLRKPREEWESIEDLRPQLLEFRHRINAEDYDNAVRLILSLNVLFQWGQFRLVARMHEQLVGKVSDTTLAQRHLGLWQLHTVN